MKKIILTNQQKNHLESLHENTRDSRICDRLKAVLLRSEGWSTSNISQALRLHETTIIRHINDYLEKEKLKPENGGSYRYLSPKQEEQVVQHLTDKTYSCSYEIVDYIVEKYQIKFSVPGLNKWLHQQGFSYKKPKGVPHKFDPVKQAEFIQQYRRLKAQVVDEPILFIDAMHPTQATKMSRGWIKKGQDKSIQTTGSRTRLNLVGAINLNDLGSAIVNRYDTVNSETMSDFFETIRARNSSSQSIHVVLDGAGYHRAKALKDKADQLNIKLYYLPPYSPNLNPIERLWKVMNEHVRDNQYFSSAKEFRDKIDDFFKVKLPEIGDHLTNRINDNFQVLKPAS